MQTYAANGGFPEPPAGELQRLVRVRHPECGAETRVRLPRAVPARVVRRVVCESCSTAYECDQVEEIGLLEAREAIAHASTPAAVVGGQAAAPRTPRRGWLPRLGRPDVSLPRPYLPHLDSRLWRWGSIAVAAVAVVAVLLLIQGDDSSEPQVSAGAGTPPAGQAGDGGNAGAESTRAHLVTEPGFTLALPAGWERVPPESGEAFAAVASDGTADATLWIERAPGLSFQEFETRSLTQLESLAGNAEIVDRTAGPTPEETSVTLQADAPADSGVSAPYRVTLRAAGPYRYYLSTSVAPDASQQAAEGTDVIHGSFIPEPKGDVSTTTTPGTTP